MIGMLNMLKNFGKILEISTFLINVEERNEAHKYHGKQSTMTLLRKRNLFKLRNKIIKNQNFSFLYVAKSYLRL